MQNCRKAQLTSAWSRRSTGETMPPIADGQNNRAGCSLLLATHIEIMNIRPFGRSLATRSQKHRQPVSLQAGSVGIRAHLKRRCHVDRCDAIRLCRPSVATEATLGSFVCDAIGVMKRT
jgi:hypothetical protein